MDTANPHKIKPPRPDSGPPQGLGGEPLIKSFDRLRTNGNLLSPFVVSLSNHTQIRCAQGFIRLGGLGGRAGRGWAALGVCLLIGVCVLCARRGLADLVVIDASARQRALQEEMARTGELATAGEARAVAESFLRAQSLEPGNPATAEQLAGLYTLNARDPQSGGALGPQWAKAREQYAGAVVMRPTSPYSWANLAWTKYYLGQVDAEFYHALDVAIRLGPWEPEVQFIVTDLGFALWDELPAEIRPGVLAMAQNGQRRNATQIAAIAQKRGRLAEVCGSEKLAKLPACKPVAG